MPEGPEIHRAADRLRKALVGKTLLEVQAEHPAIAGRLDGWVGREVQPGHRFTRGATLLRPSPTAHRMCCARASLTLWLAPGEG